MGAHLSSPPWRGYLPVNPYWARKCHQKRQNALYSLVTPCRVLRVIFVVFDDSGASRPSQKAPKSQCLQGLFAVFAPYGWGYPMEGAPEGTRGVGGDPSPLPPPPMSAPHRASQWLPDPPLPVSPPVPPSLPLSGWSETGTPWGALFPCPLASPALPLGEDPVPERGNNPS